MSRKSIFVFLCYLFSTVSSLAQKIQTANFIIVKTPSSLPVFNKYQQRVSSDQLKTFPVGIPFQILKDSELLSDGYSKAIKVSYENNFYFLVKSDNGKLKTESLKYQNVTLFSDTVEVTVSNKLFFNPENQSKTSDYLKKGIQLLRVFKDGQFFYVRKLNEGDQFGWIPSGGNYLSKRKSVKNSVSGKSKIPDFLFSSAEKKINAINEKIQKLYGVYNQKENQNLPAPNLKIETQGEKLICIFSDLPNDNAFIGTQKYIRNELEIVFLGSGFKISKTDFGFEIIK